MLNALEDDLNTPKALAELHQLRNHAVHGAGEEYIADLVGSLHLLGFLSVSDETWRSRTQKALSVDPAKIEELIANRNSARKAKNFKESDRIRDELAAMGVVLKDSKDGTTWEIAR